MLVLGSLWRLVLRRRGIKLRESIGFMVSEGLLEFPGVDGLRRAAFPEVVLV